MSLSVENVQQNHTCGHISVENFEIPGLFLSRTTEEFIGKLGHIHVFQQEFRLKLLTFVISEA